MSQSTIIPLYPQLRSSFIICGNVHPLGETRKALSGKCQIVVEDL